MQADLIIILPEIVLALYAMAGAAGRGLHREGRLAPLLTWTTAALFVGLALLDRDHGEGTRWPLAACSTTMALRALPRW
jgi:NADH-quinone oxidoreductase subunit N